VRKASQVLVTGGKNMTVKHYFFIAVFIVLSVIGINSFKNTASPRQSIQLINLSPDCDPSQQACGANLQGLSITLSTSQPVSAMKLFDVKLQANGFSQQTINKASANFVMQGMEMGLSKFNLAEMKKGIWQGQAMLPVCTSGRSDWLVEIKLETKEQEYLAQFQLKVN